MYIHIKPDASSSKANRVFQLTNIQHPLKDRSDSKVWRAKANCSNYECLFQLERLRNPENSERTKAEDISVSSKESIPKMIVKTTLTGYHLCT